MQHRMPTMQPMQSIDNDLTAGYQLAKNCAEARWDQRRPYVRRGRLQRINSKSCRVCASRHRTLGHADRSGVLAHTVAHQAMSARSPLSICTRTASTCFRQGSMHAHHMQNLPASCTGLVTCHDLINESAARCNWVCRVILHVAICNSGSNCPGVFVASVIYDSTAAYDIETTACRRSNFEF